MEAANSTNKSVAVTHTPTPWTIQDRTEIYKGNKNICSVNSGNPYFISTDEDRANAAHIVKCVNNNDLFVSALNGIIYALTLEEAKEYANKTLREMQK